MRPLLMQVTAFTAAHTVTLALATLGFVNIPDDYMWIVESIIAASIVYVAVENIFSDGLNPWRPAIIFGFGLLHGLGFASVLGAYGLPDNIPISALGPDAVEAYLPLLFMVAALAGLSSASCAVERFDTYRHMVAMPASIGIALIGAYWVVERVFL